jgi:hypothetical protein
VGGEERGYGGEEKGIWRGGVGVIAMIYGVSERWGSANGRVGGWANAHSKFDFPAPNLIPYKPMIVN